MASAQRNQNDRLSFIDAIAQSPWSFDFFQVLRRIEGRHPDLPRLGEARAPAEEPIRLGQQAELSFAPANLSSVDTRGPVPRISVRFLGLWGPQGPLPTHLTELARERERSHDDRTLVRFADMFHHRMLLLFYRSWRMAQPTASRDHPTQRRFDCYVGATFGLGAPAMLGRTSVPDDAKRHFAGTLASAARSADGLEDILTSYLRMPVSVASFHPHWMRLPPAQRSSLGLGGDASRLGVGTVLGARVRDAQHHIAIRFGPIDLERYERMLPGAPWQVRAHDWVRLYAGEAFGVRASVSLHADQVPGIRLGVSGKLGWTTWIGNWRSPRPADGVQYSLSMQTD